MATLYEYTSMTEGRDDPRRIGQDCPRHIGTAALIQDHSKRNAVMGSTRVARLAGK